MINLLKPRFPIKIPIDQMKPKKNYLQLLKSDSFTEKKLSNTNKSQKSSRTEKPTNTTPSQNSQRIRSKVPKDIPTFGKQNKKNDYLRSNNTLSERNDSFNESRNLKKSSEPKITDHLRTSHQSLEVSKGSSALEKAYSSKLSKNRASSTNRPASSRSFHNVKQKHLEEVRRSSELQPRIKDNSRLGHEYLSQEMTEENKQELIKRTKMIITENLKKYNEQIKAEKENVEKTKDERKALKEKTESIKKEIKEKNRLRNQSGSPTKHKYGWGVDQKRLEMKPQSSKDNKERWQKKESPKRRDEIGLSHLNKLDEEAVKKARTGWKQNIENKIKEDEEKYKKKRNDKSPDDKEKIKKIIDQQFKKNQNEKRKASTTKEQEEQKKKQRLEALSKNIEEIRAKDQAVRNEETEKNKDKPKKKTRKPFRILDNERESPQEEEEEEMNEEADYEEEEEEPREEKLRTASKQKSQRISSSAINKACNILQTKLLKPALRDALNHWRSNCQRRESRQLESVKKAKNSTPHITPQKPATETYHAKSTGKIASKTEQKISFREEELARDRNQSEGRNLKSAKTPAKETVVMMSGNKKSSLPTTSAKKQFNRINSNENVEEVFINDYQQQGDPHYQEYKKLFNQQQSSNQKQNKIEYYERDIDTSPKDKDFGGKDFDDMLFNLSSEELIRLPYFSIAK